MYSTVIGNGRTLQEDDVICGYHIPKGVSTQKYIPLNPAKESWYL